jgi:hypothetical protein
MNRCGVPAGVDGAALARGGTVDLAEDASAATGATTAEGVTAAEPYVGTFRRCGKSLALREVKLGATLLGLADVVAGPVPGSFVGGALTLVDCASADLAADAVSVASKTAIDNRATKDCKVVGPHECE